MKIVSSHVRRKQNVVAETALEKHKSSILQTAYLSDSIDVCVMM